VKEVCFVYNLFYIFYVVNTGFLFMNLCINFIKCIYTMSTNYDIYDNAFLGILQNEGNIETFLDAVFSFLYRR